MALIEKVCLYYREGTSDKVYEIHLTHEDDGYRVTGYNGRRGTKLSRSPRLRARGRPRSPLLSIIFNPRSSTTERLPYSVSSRETPHDRE